MDEEAEATELFEKMHKHLETVSAARVVESVKSSIKQMGINNPQEFSYVVGVLIGAKSMCRYPDTTETFESLVHRLMEMMQDFESDEEREENKKRAH